MEDVLNEFISYLFTIGLLSDETVDDLVQTYQEILQMNKDINQVEVTFKNDMTRALMHFINTLSADKMRLMSLNVILKFIENHQLKQSDKLRSAVILASRITRHRVQRFFGQWHRLIQVKAGKKMVNTLMKEPSRALTQWRLETSWDKKEREDFEQCTFHPITNRYKTHQSNNRKSEANATNLSESGNKSVYDRLYSDKDKYKLRKEMLALQMNTSQSVSATFTPDMAATPTKLKYQPKALFHDRQKSFNSFKSKNRDRIKAEVDSAINQNLTFSPIINKAYSPEKTEANHVSYYSSINPNTPTYIRLYEDNSKRNQRSMHKPSNQTQSDSVNSLHFSKKSVDYSKIEQLYATYKAKKQKVSQIQREMEEEQGMTFKPFFQNKTSVYDQRVEGSSVLERTQAFLKGKKDFVDMRHQTEEQLAKEKQIGYRQYTKEEKDRIAQKIIERLYKRDYSKPDKAKGPNAKTTNDLSALFNKNSHTQQRQTAHLNGNVIEGLPSTDMIKTQTNETEDYAKPSDIKKLFSSSQHQAYGEGMQGYFNDELKAEDEEELMGKYNDKLISIDEYTFGKNKKSKRECEQKDSEGKLQSEEIARPYGFDSFKGDSSQ